MLDVDTGAWSKVDVIPGGKYAAPKWTPDSKAFYYEWLPVDPAIPVDRAPGLHRAPLPRAGHGPEDRTLVHPRTGDPTTFLVGGR